MRVQPVFSKSNISSRTNKQTLFESKANPISENRAAHRYTGVVSTDLAYASMFDNAIAKDLKLMGLI